MTAGRGIVHSERAGSDLDEHATLHGIQCWLGLPEEDQECDPSFIHYPEDSIPRVEQGDVMITIIMGEAFRQRSPVKTYSQTLYLDCVMPEGSELLLPECEESAVYVVSGESEIDAQPFDSGAMIVATKNARMTPKARVASRIMVVGGAPIGKRFMWWNLVSTSQERIEQAKADWKAGRFDKVPGDDEFIPLPE